MLLRADPQGNTISMLSFPRDLIVNVQCPDGRSSVGRINSAYAIWDRLAPERPVKVYPRTDEGWREAWVQYVSWEPGAQAVPRPAPGAGY